MARFAAFSFLPTPSRKTLAHLSLLSLLCTLSYLLGLYLHSAPSIPDTTTATSCVPSSSSITTTPSTASSSSSPPLDFEPHHLPPADAAPDDDTPIPPCTANFTDYCPCQDPSRERRFHSDEYVMFHRERHCPPPGERPRCRVPPPPGHRTPFRWPESRDRAWFANVPSTRLSKVKANQNWVRVEGDQLVFPGGGTSFPNGVNGYVDGMEKIVPLRTGEIRTALDIGCGVASFGGRLTDYNILTLSVAPRDVHEAQVQFALERGLPAMLGVLSLHRLPYPSRSFDLAHCARCLIKWADHGGLYLLEIDRVLRPGGFWVLSGPPINWKNFYKGWERTPEDLEAEQKTIEDVASRLCWTKFAEEGPIAVWRKPLNHVHCQRKATILNSPPFCKTMNPDAAWYKAMDTCISPLPTVQSADDVAGGALAKGPKRLTATPPRIASGSIEGITAKTFSNDNQIWNQRLTYYERYISSIPDGKYRNVMDMNAGLGGFAYSLSKYPVWVMNVVPFDIKNDTLGIIYERGFIGTYMDWCEAFSTYPRTYDLIHASGILSMYMGKCDIIDILLEMDRILRPQGAVIIRDHVDIIVKAKRALDRLKWQSRIVQTEKGPFDPEKLLIVDNSIV